MATKDSELIHTLDEELQTLNGALIQVRNVTKALEAARDTLRYTRNVLTARAGGKEEHADAHTG